MRLVYSADLHGDITSYHALLTLAVTTDAQAAIVAGDLLPHAIKLQSALAVQRRFIDQELRPLLERFCAEHPALKVYLLAGNDDWAAAISALDDLEAAGLAAPLHERVYPLEDGLVLAGYACVPFTPFSIKDYERRDSGQLHGYSFGMAYTSWNGQIRSADEALFQALPSIADDLAALARRSDPARTIFACHTPPANTPLDLMSGRRHVGSHALRTFIEQHQPPLTLHGHIHEAPRMSGSYATRIGPTWCINAGHDGRWFHAVALDTDDIAGTLEHTVFGPAHGPGKGSGKLLG